jgi:hypothetical protein
MNKWVLWWEAIMPFAMVSNAQQYDWRTWVVGIMRSAVQGGATSIASISVVSLFAPNTFNLNAELGKTLAALGILFLLHGVIGMATFLQTHGAPDLMTTTKFTETQTTVTAEKAGVAGTTHMSSVETTTTVPVVVVPSASVSKDVPK